MVMCWHEKENIAIITVVTSIALWMKSSVSLLCGHFSRPHYRSCLYPSICLSCTGSQPPKQKGIEKSKLISFRRQQ